LSIFKIGANILERTILDVVTLKALLRVIVPNFIGLVIGIFCFQRQPSSNSLEDLKAIFGKIL